MSSANLSSALVNTGLLSYKQIAALLARQALRGGSLDTLLLEEGRVDEVALVRVLAQASGYPPLLTAGPEQADPAGGEEIPRLDAERLNLCPVAREGHRVTVLVTHATCPVALQELAYELDRELVPLVTAEVRVAQAQQRVYGRPLSPRLDMLLQKLGRTPAPRPQRNTAAIDTQQLRPPARRTTLRFFGRRSPVGA